MVSKTSNKQPASTDLLLAEYASLKAEQVSRIGFRDNLLYATLLVVGGVSAYALGNKSPNEALLLVPWACFILGWTYVNNNRKVTDIGCYIRDELAKQLASGGEVAVFGWEVARRRDKGRNLRKLQQLLVDLLAFCVSSVTAMVLYVRLDGIPDGFGMLSLVSGGTLTLVLAVWLCVFADFGVDN